MKQTWSQIWNFPVSEGKTTLLIGSDPTVLIERVTLFVSEKYMGYKVKQLACKDVLKTPQILQEEIGYQDLFAPDLKVLFVIEHVTDKFLDVWKEWRKIDAVTPCILWSAKLSKKSSLRTYFEKERGVSCLPTYAPDQPGFKSYVGYLSEKLDVRLDSAVRELVGMQLDWDCALVPKFMEKMALYLQDHDQKEVSAQDVWACGALVTPAVEDFIFSLLKKDGPAVVKGLAHTINEDGVLIQNLIYMKYYFWRLLSLKALILQGVAPQQAVYKLTPILPPHINAQLIEGAGKWSEAEIYEMLNDLLKLDIKLKRQTIGIDGVREHFLAQV